MNKKGIEWTWTKIATLVLILIFIVIMLIFIGQARTRILDIVSRVFS